MDWAADKFVWVHLPIGRVRPGDSSSVPVLAGFPNKRCCHRLWFAEFPNRHLYSSSWVALRWVMVPMAPVIGGYNYCVAESDFVELPSLLPIC